MYKRDSKVNTCKEMILGLNVSNEVKESLLKTEKVASSNNLLIKSTIKDLFIESPSCKELSKIAKCYERIITCNRVYPIRGTRTYLELAFPCTNNDKAYKDFFASPRLVAATQDYFTGVFLISFELWNSANALIRDPSFMEMIKFINDNKEHISFVFHVTPEFETPEVLSNEISKYLNICVMKHNLPDLNTAVSYIESKLADSGMCLDKSGKQELKKLIEEKIEFKSPTYKGYQTLERVVSNLQFELYVRKSADSKDKKLKLVSRDDVREVSDSISIPDESILCKRKLGFN